MGAGESAGGRVGPHGSRLAKARADVSYITMMVHHAHCAWGMRFRGGQKNNSHDCCGWPAGIQRNAPVSLAPDELATLAENSAHRRRPCCNAAADGDREDGYVAPLDKGRRRFAPPPPPHRSRQSACELGSATRERGRFPRVGAAGRLSSGSAPIQFTKISFAILRMYCTEFDILARGGRATGQSRGDPPPRAAGGSGWPPAAPPQPAAAAAAPPPRPWPPPPPPLPPPP